MWLTAVNGGGTQAQVTLLNGQSCQSMGAEGVTNLVRVCFTMGL